MPDCVAEAAAALAATLDKEAACAAEDAAIQAWMDCEAACMQQSAAPEGPVAATLDSVTESDRSRFIQHFTGIVRQIFDRLPAKKKCGWRTPRQLVKDAWQQGQSIDKAKDILSQNVRSLVV